MLELQAIPFFLFPTTGLGKMDGQTDNVCWGKEGAKYSQAESFQSLFLLQHPLIDGSNDTSLNMALISGSKQRISKASSCWLKTMKAPLSILFNILVSLCFLQLFFFPFFCASPLPGSFSVVPPLLRQYICFVVYLPLSEPFVCLLCTQENPSLPSNSEGAARRKNRPINQVRGHKEEKKQPREMTKKRFEFLTVTIVWQKIHPGFCKRCKIYRLLFDKHSCSSQILMTVLIWVWYDI